MRQLEALGAPPEIIEQASKRKAKTECLIHDDCWQSVEVFLALGSQWRVASTMGGLLWQGIDYLAIEPYLRLSGIRKKHWQRLFADLQIMQAEAASAINTRNSK